MGPGHQVGGQRGEVDQAERLQPGIKHRSMRTAWLGQLEKLEMNEKQIDVKRSLLVCRDVYLML